ncbi:MAG: (deoxy)nucleoside triphosphate pyrophosphohydrolase [Oscillospiraceae bacterium]|nr:(deoxy)nucleoside triphosphate pyrophosphohydrolase [Oscillospiraceae bacterium]
MDVTAAVFIQNNKVLLMRRAPGHSSAGGWEYPGGKIEPGETGPECIRRELKEELLIDAEIGDLLAETTRQSDNREIHLMAYQVLSYEGTITLTDHDRMEWVPLEELLKHEQLESDFEISRQIVMQMNCR